MLSISGIPACPGEAGAIREFEDSLNYLDSNSESLNSADKM